MAQEDKSGILYLFDRPAEPVYVPKGENKVAFDIPESYLPDRYKDVAVQVFNRFQDDSENRIKIEAIRLPDLSIPMELGRREAFSLFLPRHREIAGRLIDIFMGMRTYSDLLSIAVYCRDRLNPNLFIYALSVALLHREDTRNIPIPPLAEIFPDKYVDGGIFSRAKEEANVVPPGSRIPIEIPQDYTASDLDEEHRVAYFREDVGVNLHHWHWHLVYPFDGNLQIVNKDRRGELFYYMHQQIMARYNCERLSNHLGRVKRFNNIREPIPEGYFPKLDSLVSSRAWPSRPSGTQLKDVNRPADNVAFDLQDLERWRDSMFNAIHSGSVTNTRGETIRLTEKDGIDILGNMMEASILSPNRNVYGDLHNLGHVAISYCHDPDHRYLESFGIMGDSATAMRDPIFYRWHAYINDIFMEHKATLPAYNLNQLDFSGIEITGLQLSTPNSPANSLMTFWTQSDLDLSRGLDFTPSGPLLARFTHLNHTNFQYNISVNNRSGSMKQGTVRIFMGPKVDERGLAFNFRSQKDLMIEMDKFTVKLQPGQNSIKRSSTDSSVTIPFERTFRNLENNPAAGGIPTDAFNFCGCGWPQHMLVPKGNKEGFPMDLFVMVSDYEQDAVNQAAPVGCSDAVSFCGLRDRKYPDARPMGYPFDRNPRNGVESLPQFLTPNMAVAEIKVRFTDTIKQRPRSSNVLTPIRVRSRKYHIFKLSKRLSRVLFGWKEISLIGEMAAGNNDALLYLFDRPAEPVYVPKGESKVAFDIPENYLPDRYKDVAVQVFNRFQDDSENRIKIEEIRLPDLSIPMELGRREAFSLFLPRHREIAGRLIDIFMGMRTYSDLLSIAVYCRDRLNPNLFIYALSVALLHREDTRNLPIPPLAEIFPDKYVDGGIFSRAKEEANVVPPGSRIPIEIPQDYTASDLDEEHRVAYFREDVGINLHHWHWHLVYPFDGNLQIVNKDRRGELFYYMHQQIMARYNCERLSNHLGRVKRFNNIREPIPEAYFPKLDSLVSSRAWPARPSGTQLKDINRQADKVVFDLQDLERWRDSIFNAIRTGSVTNSQGETIRLTEKDGIDILGNMMEASILSPNRNLYGDLHNLGHVAISYCHDPDHRYLESFGIMGDSATAMRDPIFYRWHAYINSIFLEHKATLPAYNRNQLDFSGIEITGLQLSTPNSPANSLMTFWAQSDLDLSKGLDFTPSGPLLARFTHLNHTNFRYNISVNNRSGSPKKGTVRIFIGPREDERGLAFNFRSQKDLMIEMDKFTVNLRPGENTIERSSTESSVTIPFERTFRNLENNPAAGGVPTDAFNFCGCGWPQHMLVPKGNKEGFPMDLFVMVSDYEQDAVNQPDPEGCSDAVSFCGLRDRKYPDARPMGYPFDRNPRDGVESLPQFLTPNMAATEIVVVFDDQVKQRPRY
ncbi:uncharacterized protein [Venturia canescens]|uniref:uncharacterized protein n=1 Tax=Venturia canescens TaxID=32260 RepID=UPI001C9BD84C|nr:uncharacterized protein LOC122418999 [Venturia canescens]